jgi:hypothetical protein
VRKRWNDEEVSLLCEFYPHFHTEKVAQAVGRTVAQCYQKAAALGLLKTGRYLASADAGRVTRGKQHPAMIASRIKPGDVPWNKGTKGMTGTHENCRATQFKKGRLASEARNYVPLGSTRISKDGYLERKVTDNPGIAPARRWVAVHRLAWEAVNGAIPAGHALVFKPGRRTRDESLITADAVELVTRAALMHRNSVHTKYPPEVARVVQLRGALSRQINARTRAMEES